MSVNAQVRTLRIEPDELVLQVNFNARPEEVERKAAVAFLHHLLTEERVKIDSIQAVALRMAEKFNLREAKELLDNSSLKELHFWTSLLDLIDEIDSGSTNFEKDDYFPVDNIVFFWIDSLKIHDFDGFELRNPPEDMCYYVVKSFSYTWEDRFYNAMLEERFKFDKLELRLIDQNRAIGEKYKKCVNSSKFRFETGEAYVFRTLVWNDFQIPELNAIDVWDTFLDTLYEEEVLSSIEDDFIEAIAAMARSGIRLEVRWLIPRKFIMENLEDIVAAAAKGSFGKVVLKKLAERLSLSEDELKVYVF